MNNRGQKLGWVITGSGHFFEECLDFMSSLGEFDLFVSKAAEEVVRMYKKKNPSFPAKTRVFRDTTASSAPVGLFYKNYYHTLVVAPATSNSIAKFVAGISDNLATNIFASENYKLIDITEGSQNAKIKIYSYESLTCPHCAHFHTKIYPLLKKDYIDTGIVKIYFKHFPLDLAALNAAKIVQCVKKEKKLSFLNHLYKTQESWVKGKKIEDINQNLKKIVKQFEINENDFDKCLALEDVENYILNSRIDAVKKFKIESTPTIIINDKVFKDDLEYKNLKRMIEKLIY